MTTSAIQGETETATVAYVDCLGALAELPTPDDTKRLIIRSPSPAVLTATAFESESTEVLMTPDTLAAIETALVESANEIWEELRNGEPAPHADGVALSVARALMTAAQDWLRPALFVNGAQFSPKTYVAAARFVSPDLNRRFSFKLAQFLKGEAEFEAVDFDGQHLAPTESPAPPAPDLVTRIGRASTASLAHRAGIAVWQHLPFEGPRGSVYVLRTNDLLKEVCTGLMLRGYSVRRLPAPQPSTRGEPDASSHVSAIVESGLRNHFQKFMDGKALHLFIACCSTLAVDTAHSFKSALEPWRSVFRELRSRRPKAVLTNMLLTPEALALHAVMREHDVKLITIQHGVTPEYNARTRRYGMSQETSSSDAVLTFSRAAADALQSSPYSAANVKCVGAPREFRTLKNVPRRWDSDYPIWYVRTSLYHGNLFRIHRGRSDHDMYLHEKCLIEQVFAKLQHGVVYKPYPALRYLDPDPAETLARNTPGVRVYSERIDLRYLVRRARILVTAGATSTLSYCLFSDRPTIFIDSSEFMPMDAAVLPEARAAFPVFCDTSSTFHSDLYKYLGQPLQAIEQDWIARAEARRRFMDRYLHAPTDQRDGSPGEVAHKLISNSP